jgi:hypothetical protein
LEVHTYALSLRKRPWKYLGTCNAVPGAAWRCGGWNSGGLGRGAAGEELGVARARFVCSAETERRPESTGDGVRRRAPLELWFRRTGSSAWATSGLRSFGGVGGRVRCTLGVTVLAVKRSSLRGLQWQGAALMTGGVYVRGARRTSFIVAAWPWRGGSRVKSSGHDTASARHGGAHGPVRRR